MPIIPYSKSFHFCFCTAIRPKSPTFPQTWLQKQIPSFCNILFWWYYNAPDSQSLLPTIFIQLIWDEAQEFIFIMQLQEILYTQEAEWKHKTFLQTVHYQSLLKVDIVISYIGIIFLRYHESNSQPYSCQAGIFLLSYISLVLGEFFCISYKTVTFLRWNLIFIMVYFYKNCTTNLSGNLVIEKCLSKRLIFQLMIKRLKIISFHS